MRKVRNDTRDRFLAGLLSLATVVASGWVGDGLNGQCLWQPFLGDCGAAAPLALLLRAMIAGLLFWVSIMLLYRVAKRLLPVRHLARTPQVGAHAVLITALSPLRPKPVFEDGRWVVTNGSLRVALTGDLKQDIDAFTALDWLWNGQQFLRCLKPHSARLRHLVLIGSPGDRGSFDSLEPARDLAQLYAPAAEIIIHPDPVGPEDIEGLQACFDRYIEQFQEAGFAQREIILDATGGQKTTSIAAALTTLRWEHIEFQYVQTEADPPGGEIRAIGFNLIVDNYKGDSGT
jgi:hypothetical protein